MANKAHLKVLKRGVQKWNEWRLEQTRSNPDVTVDLSGAKLAHWRLAEVDLSRADLAHTVLVRAHLMGADLTGADFFGANLTGADLTGADLTGAILQGADLTDANLSEAALAGADLIDATLTRTDFTGANLTSANLGATDLSGATLDRADLGGASLIQANLLRTALAGTNFTGTSIGRTALTDLDLREVRGLEAVEHQAPSTVGIDTLFRSAGEIPEAFLRGCGVPEGAIAYTRSLIGKPIDYYSCFISYSHKDEEFARRLYSRMRDEHLRVWYAPEDMAGGKKLHDQIDAAIRTHDKLLVVLSPNSMASEWVKTEIYKARERELIEGRRILFPIGLAPYEEIRRWEYFDADSGKDLARELRDYFIPDFSEWKDAPAFDRAFARLLRDLQTNERIRA